MRLVLLGTCLLMGLSCRNYLPLPKDARWDQASGRFAWWGGSVILPVGFSYEILPAVDSFEGQFTAPNGSVVIRHDIGGYAGAWAKARRAGEFFEEWDEQGSRVWLGHKPWGRVEADTPKLVAVTFPDAGCANFFIEHSKSEDFEWILQVARSFRPAQPVKQSDDCR